MLSGKAGRYAAASLWKSAVGQTEGNENRHKRYSELMGNRHSSDLGAVPAPPSPLAPPGMEAKKVDFAWTPEARLNVSAPKMPTRKTVTVAAAMPANCRPKRRPPAE